jgi:hypothetical protein
MTMKSSLFQAAPAHREGLGVGEGMALGEGAGVGVRIGVAVGEGEDVGDAVGVGVAVGVRVEVEVEAGTGLLGGGKPGTGVVCGPFTLIVASREINTAKPSRMVIMTMMASRAPSISRFVGCFEWI